MKSFSFQGELSASKSLMNRALIVSSFFGDFSIVGDSVCEDVTLLKKALDDFKKGEKSFAVGSGGTTFRFLLSRLSREVGEFRITGSERLFSRPMQDLYSALKSLGAEVVESSPTEVLLRAKGWDLNQTIALNPGKSSQFASSLLLSAWNLNQPLKVHWTDKPSSLGYLEMTLKFLKNLGMKIELDNSRFEVPSGQRVLASHYSVEPDMSSAFALAAMATVRGVLKLENWPQSSLQPDAVFTDLLKKMGVSVGHSKDTLQVKGTNPLPGVQWDIANTPDLFPVLAILLSRAEGVSKLSGLEVLKYKESDRLQKTQQLLQALNFSFECQKDQFIIYGKTEHSYTSSFSFDPDQDHRMAMAAALACHQGARIHILHKEVVNKSFPEFWEITGL